MLCNPKTHISAKMLISFWLQYISYNREKVKFIRRQYHSTIWATRQTSFITWCFLSTHEEGAPDQEKSPVYDHKRRNYYNPHLSDVCNLHWIVIPSTTQCNNAGRKYFYFLTRNRMKWSLFGDEDCSAAVYNPTEPTDFCMYYKI